MKNKSFADLILRVDKTPTNKFGIQKILKIPSDEVCVLYLGGNGTESLRAASGNAKIIEREILPNLPTKVPVYAARYVFNDDDLEFARDVNFSKQGYNFLSSPRGQDFVSVDDKNLDLVFKKNVLPRIMTDAGRARKFSVAKENLENLYVAFDGNLDEMQGQMNQKLRTEMMNLGYSLSESFMLARAIRRNSISSDDLKFKYIANIFNKAILPRISENGHRLPTDVAVSRVRKLNVVAHCHGAFVAQQLEEQMANKMRELGYSAKEIAQIQSQMLVVSHAPVVPLGKSRFRVISFTSTTDYIAARPKNWVTKYVRYKQWYEQRKVIGGDWMPSCFLEGKNGDVFVIHNAYEPRANGRPNPGEHQNAHYVPTPRQTDIGMFMNVVAGNILTNGIKNSLSPTFVPLPPTEELILGEKHHKSMQNSFEKLKRAGRLFMADVYKFATMRIHELQMKKERDNGHKNQNIGAQR